MITEVIPAKRWKNMKDGRTASLYGAVPWTNEAEKPFWKLEQVGWTWKNGDGTVGICRKPVETYEEAVYIMNKVNGSQ